MLGVSLGGNGARDELELKHGQGEARHQSGQTSPFTHTILACMGTHTCFIPTMVRDGARCDAVLGSGWVLIVSAGEGSDRLIGTNALSVRRGSGPLRLTQTRSRHIFLWGKAEKLHR